MAGGAVGDLGMAAFPVTADDAEKSEGVSVILFFVIE
jgi:hypothetical protein